MEIKVREVTDIEEKSSQQIEQELLDKHEQKQQESQEAQPPTEETPVETPTEEENKNEEVKEVEEVEEKKAEEKIENNVVNEPQEISSPPVEMKDDDVLSYIGKRYGKQIDSLEELISEKEKNEPLPDDVAAYLKYKKETGRGINDYAKLQRDYSEMNPDALLKEYLTITEEGLDSDDIDSLMEEFTFDEEVHEPAEIKKIKLAKKKEIAKAKKFLKQQQEQYKQPLESRESSATANKELIEFRQLLETAQATQAEDLKKSQWFAEKTNEVLTSEFKGFKFNIDDTDFIFSPASVADIKKAHETPLNLVNKFMDSNGYIKDTLGYHKALAVAMNPEKFAKFFYEQGKSQATDEVIRKTKNVNMTQRNAPEVSVKSGFQVKSVSQPSSRGLKIKSIKKT